MYKLKSGGIVGRPSRIGNTFIGSQTDLSQYGYYRVTNQKPNDAPEGQRYEDSGNGTYDEQAMTYTADWVLVDIPVQPKPDYGTKITKLAMRKRFTFAEKVTIETAAETTASVRVWLADLSVSSYVDLTDPDTVSGVNMLETEGLIGVGRADEILNTPVQPQEVAK